MPGRTRLLTGASALANHICHNYSAIHMVRIPLPACERSDGALAHPFPFQISQQTAEFLQAMLFYAAFTEFATGGVVRQRNGVQEVETAMRAQGLQAGIADQAWQLLSKYRAVFEGSAFQTVVIGLNSHWDWYIRRLSEFIHFARKYLGLSSLGKREERRLAMAGRLPINEQLAVVELAAGVTLSLRAEERNALIEMSLVRNLGLHNRWEIDEEYLSKTSQKSFARGELRIVLVDELRNWQSVLVQAVHSSAVECAKRFYAVPNFTA